MTTIETFNGHVVNAVEALILFEACRLGKLKRCMRRLADEERALNIISGKIFIWDEAESGIKRFLYF